MRAGMVPESTKPKMKAQLKVIIKKLNQEAARGMPSDAAPYAAAAAQAGSASAPAAPVATTNTASVAAVSMQRDKYEHKVRKQLRKKQRAYQHAAGSAVELAQAAEEAQVRRERTVQLLGRVMSRAERGLERDGTWHSYCYHV